MCQVPFLIDAKAPHRERMQTVQWALESASPVSDMGLQASTVSHKLQFPTINGVNNIYHARIGVIKSCMTRAWVIKHL